MNILYLFFGCVVGLYSDCTLVQVLDSVNDQVYKF